jgi:hypothetical protein
VTTKRVGTRDERAHRAGLRRARLVGLGATLLMAGVILGAVPAFAGASSVAPAKSGCSAKITSVTGLTIKNLYSTITISGSCFGNRPHYVAVSSFNSAYNGTDTRYCGTGKAPTMHIIEWGSSSAAGVWSAGRDYGTGGRCTSPNSIGLHYKSWSSSKIVIAGFGNALGTSTQNSGAPYTMTANTPCAVVVFNPPSSTGANYTMPSGTC